MTNITTTEPRTFSFAPGMNLRVIIKDSQPWFIASDVAHALGYRSTSDMTRRLDEDEKGLHIVRTLGGDQSMRIIDQSGLFNAVLKSTKPEAKAYRKWVTGTVLPDVHTHGAYAIGAEALPPEQRDAFYRIVRDQLMDALRRHDKLTEHDHWASPRKRQERSLKASETIARDMGLPLDVVKTIATQGTDEGLKALALGR